MKLRSSRSPASIFQRNKTLWGFTDPEVVIADRNGMVSTEPMSAESTYRQGMELDADGFDAHIFRALANDRERISYLHSTIWTEILLYVVYRLSEQGCIIRKKQKIALIGIKKYAQYFRSNESLSTSRWHNYYSKPLLEKRFNRLLLMNVLSRHPAINCNSFGKTIIIISERISKVVNSDIFL